MSKGEDLFGISIDKGEIIFKEGDQGDTMYIIQSGTVEISQDKDGKKRVLALMEKGDFFGEMALIDKHLRSATATAISKCRLLPFSRTSIMDRIRQDPGVVLHLLATLCHRITQTNHHLQTIVQSNESLRSFVESKGQILPESGDIDDPFSAAEVPSKFSGDAQSSPAPEDPRQTVELNIQREYCITVENGGAIFRQGDPGNSMFIIIAGGVEISRGPEDDRNVIALLGPGDFFGETAIITDQPRTAHAYATDTTDLYVIPKNEFFEQIRIRPELALYILQGLIIRLRRLLSAMNDPTKAVSTVLQSFPPPLKKKSLIRTAIVSLSTCGGCAAVLLEDQEKLAHLLARVDISYCPMLIDAEELGEVDVAVVDGVVRVKEDEEKIKEVRDKSRYLVAWGTCAAFGGIPAYANQFELEELLEESYGHAKDPFAYYLSGSRGVDRGTYQEQEKELQLLRRARKLDDFVRVDYYIPGCPPNAGLLNHLVGELRGDGQPEKPKSIVCGECSKKPVKTDVQNFFMFPRPNWVPNQCFTSLGAACLGFMTKGGCGAVCPHGGLPCWGCRGPSETVFKKMDEGSSFEECMVDGFISRNRQVEDQIRPVMKLFRKHANSPVKFTRNITNDRSRIR
jgi:F420-non-reducing hydrogenase small subunit